MGKLNIKNKKGFTLIELLIVIVIIAIIAGAILVAINPAKRIAQAQDAVRWSEVISIFTAIKTYTMEHWGDIPDCGGSGNIPADGEYRCIGTGSVAGESLEDEIVCLIQEQACQPADGCCYNSLAAWEADLSTDGDDQFNMFSGTIGNLVSENKIAVAKITGTWIGADNASVTIDGWTTSDQYYIKIYTDESARHDGVWDNSKYRLEGTNSGNAMLTINEDYVRIQGLQVKNASGANNSDGIECGGTGICSISHNIIGDSGGIGIDLNMLANGGIGNIWNNIIYGCEYGIFMQPVVASQPMVIYNNTIIDSTYNGIFIGTMMSGSVTVYIKNNIVQNSATFDDYDFPGSAFPFPIAPPTLIGSNNISDDPSAASEGIGSASNLTFVDEIGTPPDYHLRSPADTDAINAGVDLSADSDSQLSFANDIDSGDRPAGVWDIGADEEGEAGIVIDEGGSEQCCDLGPSLVSDYLDQIPEDPTAAVEGVTGYEIKIEPSGTIWIRAPYASEYAKEEIIFSQ